MAGFGDIDSDLALAANQTVRRNSADGAFEAFNTLAFSTQLPPVLSAANYFDLGINGLAKSTIAGVANRLEVIPFFPNRALSVDRAQVEVTTAVASAQGRIAIYDSDGTNFLPSTRLYDSAELDFSTTGTKEVTLDFDFDVQLYWVGVHHSSTATLRGLAVGSMANLGCPGTAASTHNTVLRASATFGTDSPNPIGSLSFQANIIGPDVRFRIA